MLRDSNAELTARQKGIVRWGAFLTYLIWFSFPLPIVSRLSWVSAKWAAQPEKAVYFGVSVLTGLIFVGGFALFVVFLFRARCPNCNWTLLRNPKGMGPSNFKTASSCPSGSQHFFGLSCFPSYRVNPWAVQLLRIKTERRVTCLRCGRDYDLHEQTPDSVSNQSSDPTVASATPPAEQEPRPR
jgi:hypothetical protein